MARGTALNAQILNQINICTPHYALRFLNLNQAGQLRPSEELSMHNVFYLIGLIVVVLAVISLVL